LRITPYAFFKIPTFRKDAAYVVDSRVAIHGTGRSALQVRGVVDVRYIIHKRALHMAHVLLYSVTVANVLEVVMYG
jgi:hypothetical protein